jgi:phosphomannomutase/phosphoglucomutase
MFRLNSPGFMSRPSRAKQKKAGAVHISAYGNQAALLAVLIFGITVGVMFKAGGGGGADEMAANALRGSAAMAARRIADQLSLYAGMLQGYAANPGFREKLSKGGAGELRIEEVKLQQALPDAIRVRLFAPSWRSDSLEQDPDLSFAALDTLRRVQQSGKAAPAEVHQFGTPQQHVALVMPVMDPGGRVAGYLHVSLSMRLINAAIAGAVGFSGRIEIEQVAGGSSVVLAAAGTTSGTAGARGSLPVEGSIWRTVYRQDVTEAPLEERLLPLAVTGGGSLLVILVILLQNRRLRRALQSDQGKILMLAETLGSAEEGGKVPYAQLVEQQHVIDLLLRMRRETVWKRRQEQLAGATGEAKSADAPAAMPPPHPSPADAIFRAGDIRGVSGEVLSELTMFDLGRAVGSEAHAQGQQSVIVARDGRVDSGTLCMALCRGILSTGRDVVDIGLTPTPVLYFATHFLGSSTGVMVTGGHDPAGYNGLKVVLAGQLLHGDALHQLQRRIKLGDFIEGAGERQERDLLPDYLERITGDLRLARPVKLAIDCGNGAAGVVAPALFQALGCEVIDLFCNVDGGFPNHPPDPGMPENLVALIKTVKEQGADLGFAFDGDGDRVVAVDSNGNIVWPDQLLLLLARDLLSRHPGADVVYDVMSSRHLAGEILSRGGRPVMWKADHASLQSRLRKSGALLAGSFSGHLFLQERWYGFSDGLYSSARLVELLAAQSLNSAQLFAGTQAGISTPELFLTLPGDDAVHGMLERLASEGEFGDGRIVRIDGLSVEYDDGWGAVVSAGSRPGLIFRFEADSVKALKRIQTLFRQQLANVDGALKMPF